MTRGYAGQHLLGAGLIGDLRRGWVTEEEGYGVGAEGEMAGEGLRQGGLGVFYRFGRPDRKGWTVFLRNGIRCAPDSAQTASFQGGLGVLWTGEDGTGVELDLAMVPLGELGYYKYATIGVRFPVPEKSSMEKATPESIPIAAVSTGKPGPEEKVIYFCPGKGDKAGIKIQVKKSSKLVASLLDQNGEFIMFIVEEGKVDAGEHVIEWDGNFQHGAPAPLGLPYWIRVTYSGTTSDYKVIPKEGL